jgi:Lhr-like helicase
VRQAIGDSLTEAMDIAGLERLLGGIEQGEVQVVARDLTQPSPLALEVLPFSMTRRWKSAAPRPCWRGAGCHRRMLAILAGSIPLRSRGFGTPTSCTTRWSGSAS